MSTHQKIIVGCKLCGLSKDAWRFLLVLIQPNATVFLCLRQNGCQQECLSNSASNLWLRLFLGCPILRLMLLLFLTSLGFCFLNFLLFGSFLTLLCFLYFCFIFLFAHNCIF